MDPTQNAKLGHTCTKRDGEDTRARTPHTHTDLQTGKLQLVYNNNNNNNNNNKNT